MKPVPYTIDAVRRLHSIAAHGGNLNTACAELRWEAGFALNVCRKHGIDLKPMDVTTPKPVAAQRIAERDKPENRPSKPADDRLTYTVTVVLTQGHGRKLEAAAQRQGLSRAMMTRRIIVAALDKESSPVASA